MKQFKGPRTWAEVERIGKEKGWEWFEQRQRQYIRKYFPEIGGVEVCLRSFGKFLAYDMWGKFLATEESEDLDGTPWYDELLGILYEAAT